MKIYLIIIAVYSLTLQLNAQIQGKFCIGTDYFGNSYVYFLGLNNSSYNYNIEITYKNYTTGEEITKYLKPLYSGNQFTIGPNDRWWWQIGEVMIVKYTNGERRFWKYGSHNPLYGSVYKYTPSFTGSKECLDCSCSKYRERSDAYDVCKCGHSYDRHRSL